MSLISSIERSLLRGKWSKKTRDADIHHPPVRLAQAVLEGKFREVLISPPARALFRIASPAFNQPFDQAFSFPTVEGGDDYADLTRLILAIACLHAFVQVNWTGPDLDIKPSQVISLTNGPGETSASLDEDSLNQKAVSELALAGEPIYPLTKVAAFLRLAQVLLGFPFRRCDSATWWRLRVAFVHQQILDEPAPLPEALLRSVETLQSIYLTEPDLEARLILEQGLSQHQLLNGKAAAEHFVRAAKATGLVFELTGALGKRTKFQQFELSQLVLLAESHLAPEDSDDDEGDDTDRVKEGAKNSTPLSSSLNKTSDGKFVPGSSHESGKKTTEGCTAIPETIALNDDTLLEQTEFTSSNPAAPGSLLGHLDPSSQPPLHPLDQCILLCMCLNIKNTSPSHGLTNEQMSPYVARVILHPRNWSVHTMALLLRSRLESSRTRTVERSTLQLQVLIDQMPTSDSTLHERLLYFYAMPLPTKWELERELALRFLSLGVVKSALEIFERLEMWEEVVKCWGVLERPEKGVAIVRDLLEGRKREAEEVVTQGKMTAASVSMVRRQVHDKAREAKLWCLLGDLEPAHAFEHYERAWEVSQGTSGRAMRSLGGYHFSRGKFSEAIACLKRAVAINPLLAKSWFILGCACMHVEDWEGAKNAFSRCVAIDEEDGESWNNLASMYLRMSGPGTTQNKMENDADIGSVSLTPAIPFENKVLAFRALKQGLRFSYNNWRMWYNYMVVAMDVGELAEACRALGRLVEETGDKDGARAVDEDVLERLVTAVTRAPADPDEAVAAADRDTGMPAAMGPNEGHGLSKNVIKLLEQTILPRVSSTRILRAYARLLTWQARWADALKAYMDAYRCGVAGTIHETTTAEGDAVLERWREGVRDVQDIVDVLVNFGPRVDGGGKKWRMQARSVVKTFMGRTKEFEDEPEWERLLELEQELRSSE